MSLYKCIDITIVLLMSTLVASSRSISSSNTTKESDKYPPTTNTALNPSTNYTATLSESTPTSQSIQTTQTSENITLTILTTVEEHSQRSSSTEGNLIMSSPTPQADKVQATRAQATTAKATTAQATTAQGSSARAILAVSLSLGFCLLAVGIAAAVFFVRWKRIKKMKEGFQEEMAVICLHDELASEALYSSWKPFMDGNENKKVKLVIETTTVDATTSRANT